MATQLDRIKASSHKPFYDWIELSEFRPELEGVRIRVRVNPPKRIRTRLNELHTRREELDKKLKSVAESEADKRATIESELESIGAALNEIVASLIPVSDTGDETPVTVDDLNRFLDCADDDDVGVESWFMRRVWEKVYAYFLSPMTSQRA